jgi:hypothetical protein
VIEKRTAELIGINQEFLGTNSIDWIQLSLCNCSNHGIVQLGQNFQKRPRLIPEGAIFTCLITYSIFAFLTWNWNKLRQPRRLTEQKKIALTPP